MIEPKQSDIGRKVIYRVHSAQAVEGVITHFNEKYVFVRFGKEEKSVVTTQDELEWKDSRFSSWQMSRRREQHDYDELVRMLGDPP
jgi:hypothetical protein